MRASVSKLRGAAGARDGNRLGWTGSHGLSDGGSAHQGRPSGAALEPHALQGIAAGGRQRDGRESLSELRGVDVLFTMVSTGKDLEQVYFGSDGSWQLGVAFRQSCGLLSIGVSESSAIRAALSAKC